MSYSLLYPTAFICHHKGPHWGKYGHVYFQILLLSKIIYSKYSFQKLSMNLERLIWIVFVIGFSMVHSVFLTIIPKMGMQFSICKDMLLHSSEWFPKNDPVNMSVYVSVYVPKHTFTFTLWVFSKITFYRDINFMLTLTHSFLHNM